MRLQVGGAHKPVLPGCSSGKAQGPRGRLMLRRFMRLFAAGRCVRAFAAATPRSGGGFSVLGGRPLPHGGSRTADSLAIMDSPDGPVQVLLNGVYSFRPAHGDHGARDGRRAARLALAPRFFEVTVFAGSTCGSPFSGDPGNARAHAAGPRRFRCMVQPSRRDDRLGSVSTGPKLLTAPPRVALLRRCARPGCKHRRRCYRQWRDGDITSLRAVCTSLAAAAVSGDSNSAGPVGRGGVLGGAGTQFPFRKHLREDGLTCRGMFFTPTCSETVALHAVLGSGEYEIRIADHYG